MLKLKANIDNRIEVLDALRGAALLGITLRHFLTRFNYNTEWVYAENDLLKNADKFFESISYHLLYGTVYPIFALLFGLSLFLVQRTIPANQSSKYLIIRLLVLGIFACINSCFFPSGDILGLYVIAGLMVVVAINLPLQWLLVLAILFLLQPLEWGQIIFPALRQLFEKIQIVSKDLKVDMSLVATSKLVLQNMWVNVTKGQLAGILWSLETGRMTQTIGLMLFGYYSGKSGVAVNLLSNRQLGLKYILTPILFFVLTYQAAIFLEKNGGQYQKYLFTVFFNWMNLGLAFFYIFIFIKVYDRLIKRGFKLLKYYGRMSLTNYVFSTLIGGVLFAPFGFYFAGILSSYEIVLVYTALILLNILLSKFWLSKNSYGPLEFCWRKMINIFFTKKNRSLQFFFNT